MPKAPTSIPTPAHMRWLLTCSLRPDILPQQLVHSVWTQIFCIHPLFHVVSAAPWEHFSRKAVTRQQRFSELVCLRAISLQAVLAGAKFYDYISFPRMAQQQSRGRNRPAIGGQRQKWPLYRQCVYILQYTINTSFCAVANCSVVNLKNSPKFRRNTTRAGRCLSCALVLLGAALRFPSVPVG